jgi:hypothetical protein
LTSLTSSKVKFEGHSSRQQDFDKIKKVIGTEIQVLLCYPDFNKPVLFHLYTDASDHQLGAIIMQDKKSIAFYSQKLNTSQKRYSTTERYRELLSAIEICKEYKNILLDVADALSRLDIDSLLNQEEEALTLLSGSENISISNIKLTITMHTALIFKKQAKVKESRLTEKCLAQPHYSIQYIEGYDLLCYKDIMQDLHSLIIETEIKEYCTGTMNIYFIRDRLEKKRLSRIP